MEIWSKIYFALHVKCHLFLSDLNETWFLSSDFEEILKLHGNPSSGSRVVPCGQTEVKMIVVALCNFANVPKTVRRELETKSPILPTRQRTPFHGLCIVHIANSYVQFALELRTVLFPSVQRVSKWCLPREIPTLKSHDISSNIPLSDAIA
jgi:hypothetical protein